MFDNPHKIIIGLERHILETIGFDFRVRYPQNMLVKMVRHMYDEDEGRDVLAMAYDMSLDMYKTFAPIKASTFAMVLACIELTVMLQGLDTASVQSLDLRRYHTTRESIVEVMLDLLDMYTQFAKHTKVGLRYELSKFIDIKIKLNQEVENRGSSVRRAAVWCARCEDDEKVKYPFTPGSATSPTTNGSSSGNKRSRPGQEPQAMRFVYDAEEARKERGTNDEHLKDEYEEYEIEVEEIVPESESRNGHGRDRGRHQGHRNNHHDNWGPYPRNRHDRHKSSRKGGYH
jgi:CTD kinase subunit beta